MPDWPPPAWHTHNALRARPARTYQPGDRVIVHSLRSTGGTLAGVTVLGTVTAVDPIWPGGRYDIRLDSGYESSFAGWMLDTAEPQDTLF